MSSIVIIRQTKKKNKQIKKVAVAFFLFKAKQKGNFILGETKKEQTRKERSCQVVVFLKQKGTFFLFRATQKKDKKQSFFSCLLNALLKISHRLSSKKW